VDWDMRASQNGGPIQYRSSNPLRNKSGTQCN
jgi:hypothetical protein